MGSSTDAGDDASLDFSSIFATLLREKWVILVTALVVAGAVAGYTYTQPSIYQASSLVKVDPQNSGPPALSEGIVGGVAVGQSASLTGEIGVLQNSTELARRVAEDLRARTNEDGNTKESFPVLLESKTGQTAPLSNVARRILRSVTFEPMPERNNIIRITVESESPEEASAIANVYAKVYQEHSLEEARAGVRAARKFLERQAEEQREKVDRLEQRWKTFVQDNQVVEQGEGGEQLKTKYNELRARRDQRSFELEKQQTQLKLLRRQLRQVRPKLEEDLLETQSASGLQSEIQALEEKIAQMRAQAANYYAENPGLEGDTTRVQNNFPELARLLEKTEALEDRKRQLTRQLVENVSGSGATVDVGGNPIDRVAQLRNQITEKQLTVNQLQSQVSALDSLIAQYASKLGGIPGQQIQRQQIEQRLKQAQSFRKRIASELRRVSIAEESELGYVEVVRSAMVPSVPVRPNFRKNIILGVLLGIAFGVGLAFLKEATNTRLRRPEDVEEKGYNLLGVVPTMDPEIEQTYDGREAIEVEGHELSTRLMPLLNPWSPVTENYRLIRANLKQADGERPRTLLITSAQKGEGKTVTAVNLALTEALSGQRVLLIDADMRKPSAHEALGMPRTPGLASVLDAVPEEVKCWETPIDGLCIIPAGVAERGPTEILDSDRICQLLEEMHKHFDIIVIDTPPTQAASDAVVIGSQTDASSLVVSAPERDARALDSVVSSLRAADVPVAGVVLNQYDGEESDGNYSSSYYGHDDEYAEYRTAAVEKIEPA